MNNNHTIAKFMELKYEQKIITAPHGSNNDITYIAYFNGINEINLDYDTSWNSLIPVVVKINEVFDELDVDDIDISKANDLVNNIYQSFIDPAIEVSYEKVVTFIKFYNSINE